MYHKTIKHDAEKCLLRTIMKYITNVFDFILVFIATKPIYSVIELDSAAIVLRSVHKDVYAFTLTQTAQTALHKIVLRLSFRI